jgi:uncharacterized protein
MRIVIDTNVLVSGLLNPHGAPGRIVEALLVRTFALLYDDRVLSEYSDILSRAAFGFRALDVEMLLDAIVNEGERISALPAPLLLADETDLPFLELAIGGRADVLVTGNAKHFKPRRGRHDVNVVSPADFLRRYVP